MADAVQKDDVRMLIEDGIIKSKPIKGTSRSRARKAAFQKSKGRRKGQGSRSGSATQGALGSRDGCQDQIPEKNSQGNERRWLNNPSQYRHFYLKAKGGSTDPSHT